MQRNRELADFEVDPVTGAARIVRMPFIIKQDVETIRGDPAVSEFFEFRTVTGKFKGIQCFHQAGEVGTEMEQRRYGHIAADAFSTFEIQKFFHNKTSS